MRVLLTQRERVRQRMRAVRRLRAALACAIGVFAAGAQQALAVECFPVITDPECPALVLPTAATTVTTPTLYAEIEVLDGETYEVWLEPNGQTPAQDVTVLFGFKSELAGSKHRRHANIPVAVGTHELYVVQHVAASPSTTWLTPVRAFTRATSPITTELGLLTGTQAGTAGKVTSQTLGGAVQRTSPADRVLVFGKTTLNGGTVHPATLARPTDTTPLDGLSLPYYDEGGSSAIESVLPLVTGEEEVQLTSPFLSGSDVYAFYWRLNHTYAGRELGLAKMTGGAPPFTRVTFGSPGGFFADALSIFRTDEVQPAGHAVVSGSTLYLYGSHRPSGATSDQAFVARVALSAVETKTSYEYWTDVGGVKAWRTSATPSELVPLWDNTGPPSVQWNAAWGRWVAVHSVEQGTVAPYGISDAHSILAVRNAVNLEGPWSPMAPVWQRPQTTASGRGSAFVPTILPGLESG